MNTTTELERELESVLQEFFNIKCRVYAIKGRIDPIMAADYALMDKVEELSKYTVDLQIRVLRSDIATLKKKNLTPKLVENENVNPTQTIFSLHR